MVSHMVSMSMRHAWCMKLASVHICLSRSSGILYRSSNADYAGESSPHEACLSSSQPMQVVIDTRCTLGANSFCAQAALPSIDAAICHKKQLKDKCTAQKSKTNTQVPS